MVKAKRDIVNSIIILFFCGIAYYQSTLITDRNLGKTGADFFPNIVIGIVAFLGVCLLINSLMRLPAEKGSKLNLDFKKLFHENKKVIYTFALFGVYVFLLGYIGYFISSILFLISLYLVLANKKQKLWIVSLGFVALTLILYLIFRSALQVFLPTGVLF